MGVGVLSVVDILSEGGVPICSKVVFVCCVSVGSVIATSLQGCADLCWLVGSGLLVAGARL